MMRKTLLTVATALMFAATSFATSLKVVYLSGEEAMVELAKIQHIDLTGRDGFKVVGTDGTVLKTGEYNQTQKLVFKEGQTGCTATAGTKVDVYPNPTQDALYVSGAENGTGIQVFDMQGKVVFSGKADADKTVISVQNYCNGTYLLKVGNSVLKFIKQ